MSIPKNHHYVSEVHIKKFFNETENKIYVYDKIKHNHFNKITTKSLFSERFSNSKFTNGEIEHSTLELDLNLNFEQDFKKHFQEIQSFIAHRKITPEIGNALYYFAKYGVIADMRTPRFKQQLDDTIFDALSTISANATSELKDDIDQMFDFKNEVKYSNNLVYSDLADKLLEPMGELIFRVQIPKEDADYYILPDIAAATSRAKINKYFNPDVEEIAYIGIPLSSKIYLHFQSEKLFAENKPSSGIVFSTTQNVETLNKANLDYCQSNVACENEEYLRKFIERNTTFA